MNFFFSRFILSQTVELFRFLKLFLKYVIWVFSHTSMVVGLRPIVSRGILAYGKVVLSVGVFLRDPCPFVCEFRRKTTEKFRPAKSTITTENWTWHFSASSFENLTPWPLVGPCVDSQTNTYTPTPPTVQSSQWCYTTMGTII